MAENSPEKSYRLSSLEQLKALLKDSGWNEDKISGFFGGIDGVNNPFKERNITESQLKELAKKLDSLKTKYEQKLVLNQFALWTLIEEIGTTYSFANPAELHKALEEQWVVYPKEYLHQSGSTFLSAFTAPRHLTKERFEKLVADLRTISGTSAKENADRGEIIRLAFIGGQDGRNSASVTPEWATVNPTQPAKPSDGTKEIREELKEINPASLDKAITISETIINLLPESSRYTLRGVHGAIIIDTLRQAGHNLTLRNGQIEIVPKPGTDVVQLSEKLQTLVNAKRLPIESLKVGMLYSSPSFREYSELKRTKDASGKEIIDPKASINDFFQYLQDKNKAGEMSADIKSIVESRSVLTAAGSVNMVQAIQGFKDLGQVGEWMVQNPWVVAGVATQAPATTTQSPSSAPSNTPSWPVQQWANAVAGKWAEFAGAMADNIWGFAKGVSQALGEGFRQGWAIGGLAVAIISIMGAWKFLSGSWGTKNHKMSGWMIALLGFGGTAGYDMMKKYGLLDGDSESGGTSSGRPRKWQETTDTSGKWASDDAADAPPESAPEAKLTPTQIQATKAISWNVRINAYFDTKKTTYTATKEDYLNFINTSMKDVPISKLLPSWKWANEAHNIFRPQGSLDPSLNIPKEMNPIILKDMLRVYVFGLSYPVSELEKRRKDIAKTINEKKVFSSDTLLAAAAKIWGTNDTPAAWPQEWLTREQAEAKLKTYRVVLREGGKDTIFSSTTEGTTFHIGEYQDGWFALDISHTILAKPIEVAFDKQAKLDQQKLEISLPLLGRKEYSMKQQDNDIIVTPILSA